jgi:hypothetical protein
VELEQRVKVLEFELKILKNEIQRTLQQVQDQVLSQYQAGAQTPAPQAKPSAPSIQKATLDEIHKTQQDLIAEAEQASADQLAAWATLNVIRLGTRRASRLIDACLDKSILTPEAHKTLMQTIAQTKENGPAKPPLTLVLDAVLKLVELVEAKLDGEEAVALIEEANLG